MKTKNLVNVALRTKSMIKLLQVFGFNLDNTKVKVKDELVIFSPVGTLEENVKLAAKLQELLQTESQKLSLRRVTIAQLITDEIQDTTSPDAKAETHKQSCLAVLNVLQAMGLGYKLDEQQENIEIQLPSIGYAPLFSSLTFKTMIIEGDKLKFNIKELLKAHKQEIIVIEDKLPLLLSPLDYFENKKVFYAQKQVDEDKVEVTPYFFVPNAITPPVYHFVLDTSSSMSVELGTLKESVIKIANALFEFQPNSIITITRFDNECSKLGSYQKETYKQLCATINQLWACGSTCLFQTIKEQLETIQSSKNHNNFLLFTDGMNTMGDKNLLTKLLGQYITDLQREESSLVRVRNKFFIINQHCQDQPEIIQKVSKVFSSSVINAYSADFIQALETANKLQEWAAARELFTCRLEVGADSQNYVRSCDLSGHFVALEPKQCKNNETIHLTIKDGNGATLLDDRHSIAKKQQGTPLLPGSAKAATQLGVFNSESSSGKTAPQQEQAKDNICG